jgi:signal peptidase I
MTRTLAAQVSSVITIAVLAGWALWLRPAALGGSVDYVVVRGDSMLPTYASGDLVVVRTEPSYVPGEVVAYRVPAGNVGGGSLVLHRIVARDGDSFTLRGDSNDGIDPWQPRRQEVVGGAWLSVPRAGTVLVILRNPAILGSLAASCVIAWLAYGGRLGPRRSWKPTRRAPAGAAVGPATGEMLQS